MASSHNVELEAAKFLHKLIQDSKDEPAKLATKLYVILQHMKSSGKEHSMPYQVISRAMETVINQHGLDIEALKSSRLPLSGGAQIGSSQAVGVATDSRVGLAENEMSKMDSFASGRPPVAPSSGAPDYYQGSVAQRSGQSFDQESPSSLDSRSANSQSQDRRDTANLDKQVNQKDGKKATSKRKRGDTSSPVEPHVDIPSQLDHRNTVNTRKGKMTKVEPADGPPVKSGELTNYNRVPSSSQMDHSPALSGSMRTMHRANQEGSHLLEKQTDLTKIGNPVPCALNSKYPEDTEASSVHIASGKHQVFSGSMRYGGVLEHDGGSSTTSANGHKIAQIDRQSSNSEMPMLRQGVPPRDMGKSTVSAVRESSAMPFKEQQLKQLRAQCLVFLAFRNGLAPKKLHLEIALGTTFSREGKDLTDNKGKSQSSNELGNSSGVMMPFGSLNNVRQTDNNPSGSPSAGKTVEADSFSKRTGSPRMTEDKGILSEERKHLAAKKVELEKQIQERVAAQASSATSFQLQDSSSTKGDVDSGNLQVGRSNRPSAVIGLNKQVNPEINGWTGFASPNEASKGPLRVSSLQHELPIERRENIPNQFQNIVNNGGSRNLHSVNHLTNALKEHWKSVPGIDIDPQGATMMKDADLMAKHVSSDGFKTVPVDDASRHDTSFTSEQEGNGRLPPPKYTMSERWIMDQQKKRLLVQQNWVQKQQKTKQRMTTCFLKLKENVSSSEDISSKTKSVIELKKLQLLELQRRLRSDFLNDFFKPITTEMEQLKSVKKHRHGRRVNKLEKYEQKMREERQKRIRERQKEFFSEIEVHKEKLDDAFKIKRERWKGINRYVKEFHKRKERIHREKVDRIQREKINLLKINDVEGYLRMVQDAKSDRVKQLLKETEKYLQKLGSKLQEAKTAAGRFEHDVDEARSGSFLEKSESTLENEDEGDQAKHYMESNEKYYMMAHSVKESIAEQPSCLQGGKLREYQMNGLRWLVSLYNNHLNGILADEMGLGKTVQVISLICYLMETKNDRGPFLVVVPSSVLPGWESEITFWAPGIHKIVYAGPPEERRRLFKERIVHQKFNVLLTTYEYLMNKHDRPKLSKIHWHYVIIDEGHRIKNASCKLNAELKHYQSSHRLLLTGTPLQNNLEELWALLNFLLPNIFNSSEDFSQWFNKPFESTGDNSPDEALLSEEENLLIINRLHQVLRPFVLRRLKHKVENELPEKIERLVRCEASAYQKLLMKRVEENLGSIGTTKVRSVHNSVMELRNICNHPYLSQLHAEEVDNFIPKHYLPPIIRLCGKLEMLDRILPKLKAADHRVLFFSTMTRLLDVMEEYLALKQHRYLRLDGHTSGGDRGALIELFNQPDSPYFIFLLSIRAGGVGVNLQAADTVIIFDTDWNPQVDLQAQARAHRIGQKKDVLVLRFETVQTVEEQVRAAAEHKLGVANQSITAGFFDNNTSAEDRREYLESLLRECKKEEAAPVLDDDALNDLLARSEAELDVFDAVDKKRQEDEMATWKKLVLGQATDGSEPIPPLPSRLVTDEDLKHFYEAMKISDVPKGEVASNGVKRKSGYLGGLDTQQYGRGKRTREVRSYEEQWTEEEFEKMCQADSPESPKVKEEVTEANCITNASCSAVSTSITEPAVVPPVAPTLPSIGSLPVPEVKEITPPAKRGRGRPRRINSDKSPATMVPLATSGTVEVDMQLKKGTLSGQSISSTPESIAHSSEVAGVSGPVQQSDTGFSCNLTITPNSQVDATSVSVPIQARGQGRKSQGGGEPSRRRGKKQVVVSPPIPGGSVVPDLKVNEQLEHKPTNISADEAISQSESVSCSATVPHPSTTSASISLNSGNDNKSGVGIALNSQQPLPLSSVTHVPQIAPTYPSVAVQNIGQNQKPQNASGAPRRKGKKQAMVLPIPDVSGSQDLHLTSNLQSSSGSISRDKAAELKSLQESYVQEPNCVIQDQASHSFGDQDLKSTEGSDDLAKQALISSSTQDNTKKSPGLEIERVQNSDMHDSASDISQTAVLENSGNKNFCASTLPVTEVTKDQHLEAEILHSADASKAVPSAGHPINSFPGNATMESSNKALEPVTAEAVPSASSGNVYPSMSGSESTHPCPPESMPVKRQGRKAQNRVEPPRRRVKKTALASPVAPDSLAVQDPKLSHHFQNSSVESLMGKATTNVAQAQAFQILLPSGVAAHDLKRKERATNSSQNKQQKGASTRIDSAPVSSDKITAFGRMQNVNDVARVMKEVFSGTCLPKPKVPDSVGSEILKTKATVDAVNNRSKGDKASSDLPNTEAACPTPGIAVNMHEKQSEGESNNQNLEDKASLDMPTTAAVDVSKNKCLEDEAGSDMSTTGAKYLTSDLAVNRLEKQSEEASNIQNLEGKASSDVPIIGAVDASNIQCKKDKADLEHEKQSEEVPNIQILEGKASSDMPSTGAVNTSIGRGFDMPSTGAACLTSDLAVSRNEKQSEETSDIQNVEGKASSDMPTTGAVDASNFQCLEDKAGSDMSTTGAECLVSDLAVNRHEKQSEEASDIQNLEEGISSSDMPITGALDAKNIQCKEDKAGLDIPTTEAACPTLDHAVNKYEKQSVEAFNIQDKASSDMPATGVVDVSNNQCLEDKAGTDEPTFGAAGPTSDLEVNQHEKKSEEASNIQSLEGKASSDVPSTGALSTSNIQCLEDKAGLDISITEDACLTLGLAVNRQEKQSEEASDIQNLGDKVSSDMPTTGAVCLSLTSIIPVNGNVQQFGPPPDPEITLLNEELPNVSEVETCSCDDIKEKEDQIQHCAENSSAQGKTKALDATPISSALRTESSSELCSKSSPPASCGDVSGLLIQGENMGDQPQLTPSCPATSPDSKATVISTISEHDEINSRNEANCSLQASDLLGPESQTTVGNNSQNALEPSIEQKHSDVLKHVELHETSLVKGCSETFSEEKMDKGDSICEQSAVDKLVNIDPVAQENTIFPTPISNSNIDFSEVCPMDIDTTVSNQGTVVQDNEIVPKNSPLIVNMSSSSADGVAKVVDQSCDDPVDRLVLQQPSGSEAVANDLVDVSWVGPLVEETIAETATMLASSSGKEENKFSSNDSSETLEESMEKGVANSSEFPEECTNATKVPSTIRVLLQESVNSEADMGDQGKSQVGGISESRETRILAVSVTFEGKKEGETLSDKGQLEARDESKGLADMENQVGIIESCAAEMEVPCSSASGDKVEGEKVIIGTKAEMQLSEDSEAVTGDEMDVFNGCSAVPEKASVDGVHLPCSSAAASEHKESLPGSSVLNPVVELDTKESEAGVANQDNQSMQQNALKDAEQCPSSAAEDRIEDSLPQKDGTECSSSLPETASVDGVPPPCSSAAEGELDKSLPEKALVDSGVKLDTEEAEAAVTPQDNQVMQENALKDMEQSPPSAAEDRVAVSSPEKNLTAGSEAPQEPEVCENVQSRSEEEPGQSSVAEEAKSA